MQDFWGKQNDTDSEKLFQLPKIKRLVNGRAGTTI